MIGDKIGMKMIANAKLSESGNYLILRVPKHIQEGLGAEKDDWLNMTFEQTGINHPSKIKGNEGFKKKVSI